MLSLIYTERERNRFEGMSEREKKTFAKQYEIWEEAVLRGGVREKWERYYKHK